MERSPNHDMLICFACFLLIENLLVLENRAASLADHNALLPEP
jgi:hypothetical protein